MNRKDMQISPCNALLTESCRIYREIELIYSKMMEDISDSTSSAIVEATEVLNSLLKEGKKIDDLIAENLDPTFPSVESTQVLLRKRDEILQHLHGMNRTLANRAENIQTLVRHEIGNMTKNRNALKSYKPIDKEKKGIIRNAF